MSETWSEEVARLTQEIAERQMRLQILVCGDQAQRVTVPTLTYEQMLYQRSDEIGS